MERLRGHFWPGNVRELENVLERAMHISQGDLLDAECLPRLGRAEGVTPAMRQGAVSIDEVEKVTIARTMEAMGGNVTRAAQVLRISRNTLYNKIRRYGL